MKKTLLTLIFLFSSLIAEDSLNQKPEELVRQFARAVIKKDSATIKKICLYHKKLKLLWESPTLNIPQEEKSLSEVDKAEIQWLKTGDSIKLFGGAEIPTNKNMINKKRKICQLRHPLFITPLQLVFIRKQWRIKAHWMIAKVAQDHKKSAKKERANYKIIIDGKEYPIHLNKTADFTLADGQKVKIQIQQNDSQFFKSAQLEFTYSQQLELNEEKNQGRQTVQLKGDFATRFLIEVHPKEVIKKDSLLNKMCKIYEENYTYLKAQFDSRGFQKIDNTINGENLVGRELHTMLNKQHQIDRFYTFEKANKTILIHSHSSLQESNLYRKLEKQIFESLKVQ